MIIHSTFTSSNSIRKKNLKNIFFLTVLLIVFSLVFSFSDKRLDEYNSPAVGVLVADWERAKAYTLEYLNAANDEVINFKPTAEMRTFGQQMLHLAEANYALAAAASGKISPVAFGAIEKSDKLNTKDAVTKEVIASYDFVIAAAKEITEPKMKEMTKVFNFELTRGAVMDKVFEHQTHHRGQTTVYLRLKGIAPPQEKLF